MGLLDKIQFWPSTNVRIPVNTTSQRSSIIDMDGAEGCLFLLTASSNSSGAAVIRVMDSTGNSTAAMLHLRSKAGAASATGGIIDVTTGTYVTDTHNGKGFAIDVIRPSEKRYVMMVIDGASGANVMSAITYGLRRQGTTEAKDSTSLGGTTTLIDAATS